MDLIKQIWFQRMVSSSPDATFFFMHERTAPLYSVSIARVKIKEYVTLIYLGGTNTGRGEL